MAEYTDEYPVLDEVTGYELVDFDDWKSLDEESDDLLQESVKEVS